MPDEPTTTATTTVSDTLTETDPAPEPTPDAPTEPTPDADLHWSRREGMGFDSDTIGWLENKGFENAQAAVTSQRELEGKLGGSPEMLQKWPESDDKEGFEGIFRRLGKPEDVGGYKFEFEEGAEIDKDTLEWFKGAALSHNMTNDQAQGVMSAWNTEVARLQEEQAKALEVRDHTEQVELENQWGTKCAERLDYGHRAMLALGLEEDAINKIQDALGPKALAEFAAKMADTMGEDSIASNTDTPAFGTTKEQVQNSINELNTEIGADGERYKRFFADHSAHKESTGKDYRKMQQLQSQLENLIKAGA